jgi:hypothetical protein
MLIEAIAQSRFVQKAAGLLALTATQLGSLRVGLVEGEGDEMTRAGMRYHMSASGATGIAPVQALPSTAAQWLIYNPAANTVSAFVDRVGMYLVSGTAGAGGTVIICIVPPAFVPTTVPTVSTANVKTMNASPVSQKASALVIASGQTLQNAAVGNWWPVAWMNPAGTVLGQTQMDSGWDVRGKLVIPPGCGLAMCVISPTGTTPLFAPFASWREYASDLE